MLQVFFGTDIVAVRAAALAALAGGEIIRIEAEAVSPGQLEVLAQGSSLFGETQKYLLDTPSSNQVFLDTILHMAEDLAQSAHQFVVVDTVLLAADKKILAAVATDINEYKKVAKTTFNQFAITDALATRDKRQVWLLLQEAWQEGVATEEVIGMLWWQLKTMRLAACTHTAAEAGMKDFPYRKAKAALQKFPLALVEEKARALMVLYHDARWGKGDLRQLLEIWVLGL